MMLLPSFLGAGADRMLEGTGYALAEFRAACEDIFIRLGMDENYCRQQRWGASGRLDRQAVRRL